MKIENKNFRIDYKVNIKNVQQFQKYKFDGTKEYTCVICKNKKDIFHMISNNGDRMICTLCAKENYGSEIKALNEFCLYRIKESR